MSSAKRYQLFLSSPLKTFFGLWIPLLFSMVAEPLTGLIDTAFIARLGSEALTALGVGTMVLTSGLWLFNFLSVGSQTEISQACGEGNLTRARRIASLALFLATLIGIAAGAFFFLASEPLSLLMGADGNTSALSTTYIQIRSFGSPMVLLSMTSFAILYGLADMRSPLVIALGVNLMNIVLDYLLIFGWYTIPAMGIAGAAWASTLSQWSGAMVSIYLVHKRLRLTGKINPGDTRKLIRIGRDMIMRTGFLLLFLILATRSATLLGPQSGAAHQAIRQVWIFSALFLDATAVTAQSLIGYFCGSTIYSQARFVAKWVIQWALLLGIMLFLCLLILTEPLAEFLVPASAHSLFYPAWIVSALFQPIAALAFVTDGIHWGTGDFTYLRNGVIFATLCGSSALLILEIFQASSLVFIWWVTGCWLFLRAGIGVARVWPGSQTSPLRKKDLT